MGHKGHIVVDAPLRYTVCARVWRGDIDLVVLFLLPSGELYLPPQERGGEKENIFLISSHSFREMKHFPRPPLSLSAIPPVGNAARD